MADGVKWIHITSDVFDNWKIKHIKAMPEVGHTLVCIWFELLCLAGQCNHPSGLIVMSERFIISEEMIASTFNEDIRMVRLALKTFEECGMIQVTDSQAIQISNWFEYQNEAGLAQIREYEAEKKAKTRAKKKIAIEDKKMSMDMSMDKSTTSPCFSSLSISNIYDFKKHNNKENLIYILNSDEKYEKLRPEFIQAMVDWMEYKDERPKSKNHYQEKGLRSWITETIDMASENGTTNVIKHINKAMANQWQGTNYDLMEKANGK